MEFNDRMDVYRKGVGMDEDYTAKICSQCMQQFTKYVHEPFHRSNKISIEKYYFSIRVLPTNINYH